jgi:multiple sugar transport system ATP-binding protein
MRAEISRLQDNLGTTTIYVTHDQIEAMTMGDRIAVMRKGELQQVGQPQDLYDKPVNLFVGGFIGSPAMNMFEGTLVRSDGGLSVEVGEQRLALGDDAPSARPALQAYEGRTIVLGIRPEHVEDAALATDAPADRRLRGTVELTEALGAEIVAHISLEAKPALTEDVRELAADIGEELEEEAEGMTTLVGRVSARSDLREGDAAELAVDTGALHFFDLETGAGIYDDSTKGANR